MTIDYLESHSRTAARTSASALPPTFPLGNHSTSTSITSCQSINQWISESIIKPASNLHTTSNINNPCFISSVHLKEIYRKIAALSVGAFFSAFHKQQSSQPDLNTTCSKLSELQMCCCLFRTACQTRCEDHLH